MKVLKIVQSLPFIVVLGLNACQPTTDSATASTQKNEVSPTPEPLKSPEPPKNVSKPPVPQIVLPPPIHLKVEKAVTLKELPDEARTVLERIRTGGPFPHPKKDGKEFKNHSRRLPEKGPGYYKEYVVPSADAHLQNDRRIITGVGGELYYTENRYKTFRPISKETVQ